MKNLLNPKSIFMVNTAPITLLFFIAFGQYDVIESLLSNDTKLIWQKFALALLVLSVANAIYASYCLYKKINTSIFHSIASLIVFTVYLYLYVHQNETIVPSNIPQWMITDDVIFYPGTFLMPTLIHSLLAIVVISIPTKKKPNAWLNFLYSLCFPLLAYLFFQIAIPLWQMPESKYGTHVLTVLFITLTILFLFFISRGVFILVTSRASSLAKYNLLWKIIIAIIFPLVGLLVSNGILFGSNSFAGISPFGNFSDITFYIIALVNGITLCLPKFKNLTYRLARFLILLVCFPYVMYFFLIFLPFLPLSILAIIIIGIGFLMLAPLLLFIVQSSELYSEYSFFIQKFGPKKIKSSVAICVALIPLLITFSYLRDKHILNNSLSHVYDHEYQKRAVIDKRSLANTLAAIKQHKDRSSVANIPFLTSFYNWLVLDHMILSDAKITTLEQVFYGEPRNYYQNLRTDVKTVKIKSANATSRYNVSHKYWESTLNLSLQNDSTTDVGIYETNFVMPEGCWISDYYLFVGNRNEHGILAEKKSALWIFNQIRNENRDPGLLYYLTGNRIAFKVFPFRKNETRKTGITFVHKEPLVLSIDHHQIALGNATSAIEKEITTTQNAVYIPSFVKAKLPKVKRKPIYHFIVDVSKDKQQLTPSYENRIDHFITAQKIDVKDIEINFTNSHTNSNTFNSSWKTNLKAQNFEGGFFLEKAIRETLLKSHENLGQTYPVIITITDSIKNAIMLKDFADIKTAFPEQASYFELNQDGKIWEHSLLTDTLGLGEEIATIPTNLEVFAWPNASKPKAYLPKNNQPSIVLKADAVHIKEVGKKTWGAALNVHALWLETNLKPTAGEQAHLQLIKESMQQQIMSPVTSFIVVENEAQKKALKRKQEQILKGNKNLDTDEDTQSMSEPSLLLLMMLITIGIAASGYKKKQNADLKL